MEELPRDPNELAREILSGRITIGQLAREQARRRAAQAGVGQASAPPRSAPAAARVDPPRPVRVAPQTFGGPPAKSPASRPPEQTSRPRAAPAPTGAAAPTGPSAGGKGNRTSPPAAARAAPCPLRQVVRNVLGNKEGLRAVMVISEILNKPLALRSREQGIF